VGVAWLPAIAYMGLIWALSSMEVPDLPVRFPLRDKLVHAIEYAGLALFVAHAALRTWPDRARVRLAGVAILIACAWGILDEIHQAFVPGRSSDAADLLADAIGATAGAFARLIRAGGPIPEATS
jgi:VanZ family protein